MDVYALKAGLSLKVVQEEDGSEVLVREALPARGHYAPSVADLVGMPTLRIELGDVMAHEELLDMALKGVRFKKKTWAVSGMIGASKGPTPEYWAFPKGMSWQNFMPGPENLARQALFNTPLQFYAGEYDGMKWLVVEDDDPRWPVADGQMYVNAEYAMTSMGGLTMPGVVRGFQFNNPAKLKRWIKSGGKSQKSKHPWVKYAIKGICVPEIEYFKKRYAEIPKDVVGILPLGCLKGLSHSRLKRMVGKTISFQGIFGIAFLASSGESKVPYPVMMFSPPSVQSLIKKEWPRLLRRAKEITKDPSRFVSRRLAALPIKEEGRRADPLRILARMFEFDRKTHHKIKLSKSEWAISRISGVLSDEFTAMCVSAGAYGRYGMGVCDPLLPDRVFRYHPELSEYEGDLIGWRNPNISPWQIMPLTGETDDQIVGIDGQAWPCVLMNRRTPNRCAGDFDGDDYNFMPVKRPWQRAYFEWLKQVASPTTAEKFRGETQDVSLKDAIKLVGKTNIGRVFNRAVALTVLRQQKRISQEEWETDLARLEIEIQKVVDAIKRFSLPDMEYIRELESRERDYGLSDQDLAWAKIANGSLPGWAPAPQPVGFGTHLYRRGELILPADVCNKTTPIGRAFVELGGKIKPPIMEATGNAVIRELFKPSEDPEIVEAVDEIMAEHSFWLTKLAQTTSLDKAREIRTSLMNTFKQVRMDLLMDIPEARYDELINQLAYSALEYDRSASVLWDFDPDRVFKILESKKHFTLHRKPMVIRAYGIGSTQGLEIGEVITILKVSKGLSSSDKGQRSSQILHIANPGTRRVGYHAILAESSAKFVVAPGGARYKITQVSAKSFKAQKV